MTNPTPRGPQTRPLAETVKMPTAHLLGAYRRELLDEGVEGDVVKTLVIEAQRTMLRDSRLIVKQ